LEAGNLTFEDKYTKRQKLGKGKFSTVYKCQNKETGEYVAMKHIHKPSLSEREREFLREEIQIIKLISHPNIVTMRETFETFNYMFIIMDAAEGGELFEHIKNYELEEKEISLIMF
jgi:serine/threonine protein kinase